MKAFRTLHAAGDALIVADHAGTSVPPQVDLGLSDEEMRRHIAVDIGIAALTERVAKLIHARAVLATLSRLVVDPNRSLGEPGLIPQISDGTSVPGNRAMNEAEREARIAFHQSYHAEIERLIAERRPALLVSLHSFTQSLKTDPEVQRPWDAGLLYNEDDATAQIGIDFLRGEGLTVGDNQPYSGALTGYTIIRHAENNAIPSLFLEVRNDHLQDDDSIEIWADRVARLIRHTQKVLQNDGTTEGKTAP